MPEALVIAIQSLEVLCEQLVQTAHTGNPADMFEAVRAVNKKSLDIARLKRKIELDQLRR